MTATEATPVVTMDADSLTITFRSAIGEKPDVEQLVRDVRDIAAIREALKLWEGELVELVEFAIGRNTVEVDGTPVTVKRGSNRKSYDHDTLRRLVVAAGRDERAISLDGEPLESEADAVARALFDCIGVAYWRKGALADRGIDLDEHCEQSPGRLSLVGVS